MPRSLPRSVPEVTAHLDSARVTSTDNDTPSAMLEILPTKYPTAQLRDVGLHQASPNGSEILLLRLPEVSPQLRQTKSTAQVRVIYRHIEPTHAKKQVVFRFKPRIEHLSLPPFGARYA